MSVTPAGSTAAHIGGTAPPRADTAGPSVVSPASRRRIISGIITYVVLTGALSSIIWRIVMTRGSLRGDGGMLAIALMWCPAVAGLVTRLLYYRTLRGVGWRWAPAKYEWAGYWIPIAYASVIYLPLWAVGYSHFGAVPGAMQRVAAFLHLPLRASGSPAAMVFTYIAIVATIGMGPNSLAALGEELGWRGYLVPELAKVTSFTTLSFISGLIWASWHLPLILAADYRGAGPVWYSVLCFMIGVIGLGFLFAWLRLESGSVWPVMLLHASHNLFVQAIFDPLTRRTPFTDYTIGEFGAGFAIMASVVAALAWRRARTLSLAVPVSRSGARVERM